ncbi:MAG TPA: type IV pilin protein [Dyella sp.]|uniref:type IV pilin protein n=1 Tax=Dyella sp. TaxID=1869338 RepID=UPI002BA2116B|nr:type IV pilin protein [Dyella sp.]HUB88580.1 type IV pilin protein [Dyella sp.]
MAKIFDKARIHRPSMRMTRRHQGGFTLIELMIVVAIVAILAAIAIPQYRKYVQQSNRSTAKSALLDLSRREETYYSTNNTYTLNLLSLGYSSSNIANNQIQVPNSSNPTYVVSFSAPATSGSSASTYTAQAAPTGSQAGDSCGTYSVDYLGNQLPATSSGGSSCW